MNILKLFLVASCFVNIYSFVIRKSKASCVLPITTSSVSRATAYYQISRCREDVARKYANSHLRGMSQRTEERGTELLSRKSEGPNTEISKKDAEMVDEDSTSSPNFVAPLLLVTAVLAAVAAGQYFDMETILQQSVDRISELGPFGYFYFSIIYIIAEIVAVPAVPLTASSGYLFGLFPGTLVVLTSATIAASISFYLGRTFLRDWAMQYIAGDKRWMAIDKAIEKEGFKVVLLLRLSPLLPFALSNYLYALTSVDYWSFISATFLGFAPGSFGFVYFGTAGKAILSPDNAANIPWYVYLCVGGIIAFGAQTLGKIATNALELEDEMQDEDQ
mmetsp:Transcript_31731/g.53528  ORF Transcript_31731/g.53528 Transcript_31731/m.53528 type:complete len:333 (-) Transcript_31731:58-1056(-)